MGHIEGGGHPQLWGPLALPQIEDRRKVDVAWSAWTRKTILENFAKFWWECRDIRVWSFPSQREVLPKGDRLIIHCSVKSSTLGMLRLVGPTCRTYYGACASETASLHTTPWSHGPKSGNNRYFPLKQAYYKAKWGISGHFLHFKTTSGYIFLLPVLWSDFATNRKWSMWQ